MRIRLERFEEMAFAEAERILGQLPPELREDAEQVILEVQDWPEDEHRRSMREEAAGELLGLFEGVPLVERSARDVFYLPDRIILFAGPHADMVRTEVELRAQIRQTLLHELGHFFGFGEDELRRRGVG